MSSPQRRTYRVYCYDGVNKVVTADLIEAASDEEAIAKAEAQRFGSKCELWEGTRLVSQMDEERRQA